MKLTRLEQFLLKVDFTGRCWEWKAARSKDGYGQFKLNGQMQLAHRVSWAFAGLKLPTKPYELDHYCRNRACVRVSHLRVVTHKTNVLIGVAFSAKNARKTHCANGHPYSKKNTYRTKRGGRVCRICAARNQREYQDRKRALNAR